MAVDKRKLLPSLAGRRILAACPVPRWREWPAAKTAVVTRNELLGSVGPIRTRPALLTVWFCRRLISLPATGVVPLRPGGGEGPPKTWTSARPVRVSVPHPDHHVEDPEQGYGCGQPGLPVEFFQPTEDNRFINAEQVVKPEPRPLGAAERAPDHVVPDGDQLRALAGQELARRHPSDVILCSQQTPCLIGLAAVFDQ